MQGVLGYAFFKKGLTADAKVDGNVIRIFVVLEDSPESSGKAFNEYKAYLEKSGAESLSARTVHFQQSLPVIRSIKDWHYARGELSPWSSQAH